MNLELEEMQNMIRDSVKDFLKNEWSLTTLRRMNDEDIDYFQELHRKIAELGWLGLGIPEIYGGSGGGWVDSIVAYEEFGRALLRNPHFETALAASIILCFGDDEQRKTYLNQLAGGQIVITVGGMTPETNLIPAEAVLKNGIYEIEQAKFIAKYARIADYILISGKTQEDRHQTKLFLVPAGDPGITCSIMRSFEGESLAEVTIEGATVPRNNVMPTSAGRESLADLVEKAQVLKCAEMIGGASAALQLAVEYSKQRVQFDAHIGSFQALQHKMADVWISIHKARWLTYCWGSLLDKGTNGEMIGHMAQLTVRDAYRRAAEEAVQIHGGYGVILDFDTVLYYRTAKVSELQMQSPWLHKEKIVQSLGL